MKQKVSPLVLIMTGIVTAAVLGGVLFFTLGNPTEESEEIDESAAFAEVETLLANYCYECHGEGSDEGDVELDAYESQEELLADLHIWEGVYNNLEGFIMPPAEEAQPTDEDRAKIIAWIERRVFELDPENPDPGKVTIRRLNRDEYNNTVRDLFYGEIDIRPADDFPADDTGYGFDNVGEVLTLSPTLMERYLKASREIMDKVLVTEIPDPSVKSFRGGSFTKRKGNPDPGSGTMSSSGTLGAKFSVPADGEYRIEVRAGGSPAKNEWPLMRVSTEKGPQKDFRVDKPRDKAQMYTLTARWKKGDGRWIDVAFLNDMYDPKAKDPRQRDRNLYLREVRVTGPLKRELPPPSKAYLALLKQAGDSGSEVEKARRIVRVFAERAWRRLVTDDEVDRLMQFYQTIREKEKGTFDQGIKLALQAALVSPNFIYRGEVHRTPENKGQVVEIDEFALASRLSYFLWSSMPDEALFQLAREGELRANLDSQVERMLKDSKSQALVENFGGQWLQLRNLQLAAPDPKIYKGWSKELRKDMLTETEQLFAAIMRENRPVLEFLNADYTFLNERLAKHYGIESVKGSKFQRVSLANTPQRGGVLTHASILTITSNPTRTSAVNRGNFVLENLLGAPPPPPPEDVEIPDLEASGKGSNKGKTLREQLEIHREKKLCASCHQRMDPIGFGLENFDGIGRWREKENGKPIDASGELYTGEGFAGPGELRSLLADHKSDAFMRCLVEKMLTYALGRGVEFYDKPAMAEIIRSSAEGEHRFHALVKSIVHSVPFQKCRGDEISMD